MFDTTFVPSRAYIPCQHTSLLSQSKANSNTVLTGQKFDTHGSSTGVISGELQLLNYIACRTTVREPGEPAGSNLLRLILVMVGTYF